MKDSQGREWRDKMANELSKVHGNKKPISDYHKELEKIMRETDQKQSEKKKK